MTHTLNDGQALPAVGFGTYPLTGDDGPLRLIAPEEARPARWVRQLKSITVIVAP